MRVIKHALKKSITIEYGNIRQNPLTRADRIRLFFGGVKISHPGQMRMQDTNIYEKSGES